MKSLILNCAGKLHLYYMVICTMVIFYVCFTYSGWLDTSVKVWLPGVFTKIGIVTFTRPGTAENITVNYTSTLPPGRSEYCDSCFDHNFKYLIIPRDVCKMYSYKGSQKSIDLIIMILINLGFPDRRWILNTCES